MWWFYFGDLGCCSSGVGSDCPHPASQVKPICSRLTRSPELTWREVQDLIVKSAVPVNLSHKSWQDAYGGRRYSPLYGFGLINAGVIVENARSYRGVGKQVVVDSDVVPVDTEIPEGAQGLCLTYDVNDTPMKSVEHVRVSLFVSNERRGDIEVVLQSPHGTRSTLR